MDTFSRLVIGHASGKPILDNLPERDQIATSLSTVFAALFSNFATLQAYSSAPTKKILGTVSRLERRLLVVGAASVAIVAIIIATLVTTIVLAAHLYRQRHILERYLDLILGTALLVRDASNSGLEIYVKDLISRAGRKAGGLENVNLVEFAKQESDLRNRPVLVEGIPRKLKFL
jgi:hypothetical protein